MIDLYIWRDSILSKRGPDSTTRLILLALAKHMSRDGSNCFPGIELIMEETALSRRCVLNGLKKAEAGGWIKRGFMGKTKGWKHRVYLPNLPFDGGARGALPEESGGARGALPEESGGARGALPEESGGARGALGGARHDTMVVHQVHPSSSVNSSKNSSNSGARRALPKSKQVQLAKIGFKEFGNKGLEKFCSEQGVDLNEALRLIGKTDGQTKATG